MYKSDIVAVESPENLYSNFKCLEESNEQSSSEEPRLPESCESNFKYFDLCPGHKVNRSCKFSRVEQLIVFITGMKGVKNYLSVEQRCLFVTRRIMSPPKCNRGGIYASPLVQRGRYIVFLVANLFSVSLGVSYIIRKVFESTFRNRFRLSVCLYHDLQTKSWTLFLF